MVSMMGPESKNSSDVEHSEPLEHHDHMGHAYSSQSAVAVQESFNVNHVTEYDAVRLSSITLFFTAKGTVLMDRILWIEQVLVVLLYIIVGSLSYGFELHKKMPSQDAQGTADKMATLAAFLLGFYTSLTVKRWWRLRTDGIGNIWSSCSQLNMFISQFVTNDEAVLSAIRRYTRASLCIIFLKRRYGAAKLKHRLKDLVTYEVLTRDEVEKLQSWNNNLAESIWSWNARIVADLYKAGKIKSDVMLTFLMERVGLGRSGAALICAQMGTPIPVPYVHLLGFMVKIHNIVLGVSYGYRLGEALEHEQYGDAITLSVRAFFIPLLYNAILLINAELADPFDADVNDFPMKKYETTMESDGVSYVQAGESLPSWMLQHEVSEV